MTEHLAKCCVIKNSQHGTTNGISCLSIFLDFLEEVYEKLDEGRVEDVVGLYLDIAKAVRWR